ncbi:HpaII family restriction endonuclease [Sutterella megalosphaeroides]|uniref:Uncharacterized protein n=1 Tax=Sutterella megalosphaeroides TaxID=2494234 RepID=A0A2Z6IAH2_9BURK|nr:HpaII family restriction endonuclease [Sutterella megalosphaeroides]BBF23495.1 hypothetical protein SUTMEG_13860 [Sutterella megalosphaeroides]
MTKLATCTKHSPTSIPDQDASQALGTETALERATREVLDVVEKATVDTKVVTDDPNVVRVLLGLSTLCDGEVHPESRTHERDFVGDCVAKALAKESLRASVRSVRSPFEGRETLVAGSDASTFEFEVRRADRPLTDEEGNDALALAESAGEALLLALRAAGFELQLLQAQPNFTATLRLIDSRGPELVAALLLAVADGAPEKTPGKSGETAHFNAHDAHDACQVGRMPTVMECVERLADVLASEKNPNRLGFGWTDGVVLCPSEVVEMLRYKVRAMLLAFHAGATPDVRWDGVERQSRAFVLTKADGTRIVFEPTSSAFGDFLMETYRVWAKVPTREGETAIQRLADGRYVLRLALQISAVL